MSQPPPLLNDISEKADSLQKNKSTPRLKASLSINSPISAKSIKEEKPVTYDDYSMIPNITPKSILKHLPYKKFKKPTWKKQPCVIISCGSFSPPTYLHLRIMEEAKDCLERENFQVIGGILSPVNDQYGQLHKQSLQAADSKHRIAMARLGTQSSGWLGVSDFEVSLDKWTRVAVVLEAYGKALDYYYQNEYEQDDGDVDNDNDQEMKQQDEKKIALKFLGGSDLLKSMKTPNLWRQDHQQLILGHYGMVVVERDGSELTDEFYESYDMFTKYRDHIHAFKPSVENTISSSVVRSLIKKKQSIKYLTPDPVIEYIEKNQLYQ